MTQSITLKRNPLQPKKWGDGSYLERFEFIEPYVRNKTVLDLGCASGYRRSDWMHRLIRNVASDIVGVDVDERVIRELQPSNPELMVGDVQELRLDQKFDVVFAGELIEHLDNFQGFLATVKAHLREDGKFVLTTPNAFYFTYFLYRLWGKPRVNDEHTCWFCEDTLSQLVERNGFSIVDVKYIAHKTPNPLRRILEAVLACSYQRVWPEALL